MLHRVKREHFAIPSLGNELLKPFNIQNYKKNIIIANTHQLKTYLGG